MYFDTDTLLKYTDLKFFVTRLLWICYLLYHCKTKVFIKLFIENKGFHWSLKNKRTNKHYPYLRAGKYHAKGPYHQPFHRVYPAFLKWWINALQTTLLKHVLGFRPLLPFVFLSEELRVPLAMLLFEEWKKKKLSWQSDILEAELPQFPTSDFVAVTRAVMFWQSWQACEWWAFLEPSLCFTHPVLHPNAALKHFNPFPYRSCQFCLYNDTDHAVGVQTH